MSDLGRTIEKAVATANRDDKAVDVLNLNTVGAGMYVIRAHNPRHQIGPYAHQYVGTYYPTGSVQDLQQSFDESSDGDDWGHAMMWLFALADFITFDLGLETPEDWQFRPSPFGADESSHVLEALRDVWGSTHYENDKFESNVFEFAAEIFEHTKRLEKLGKSY